VSDESLDAFGDVTTVRARSSGRAVSDALTDPEQDPVERPADLPLPISFVYPSRTGSGVHIVSVIDDPHGQRLGCTCKSAAIRNYCWAITDARQLLGWPAPEQE
jgi:hypothetical protein